MIHIQCKNCTKQIDIPDSIAGTLITCPTCKANVYVSPNSVETEKPKKDADQARPETLVIIAVILFVITIIAALGCFLNEYALIAFLIFMTGWIQLLLAYILYHVYHK